MNDDELLELVKLSDKTMLSVFNDIEALENEGMTEQEIYEHLKAVYSTNSMENK